MSTGKGKDAGDDLPAPKGGTPQLGGVAGGSQGTDGISGGDDHGSKVRTGGSGTPQGRGDPAHWDEQPEDEDGLAEG